MSTERQLERPILDWLEDGPVAAPDRLVAAILADVATTAPARGVGSWLRERSSSPAGGGRSLRLVLAVAVSLALLAIAGLVGALLRQPAPVPPSLPTPPPSVEASLAATPSPTASPSPSDPVAVLAGRLPARIAAVCEASTLTAMAEAADVLRRVGTASIPGQDPQALTTQTVLPPRAVVACPGPEDIPDAVWAAQFPAGEDAEENVVVAWPAAFFELPDGDCRSAAGAYGRWPTEGIPDGRVACWVDGDGVAWVLWSDDGDHLAYLARRDDGDLAALLTWWRQTAGDLLD